MHQRKSKKILIYFFLLITVGSINNINLDDAPVISDGHLYNVDSSFGWAVL